MHPGQEGDVPSQLRALLEQQALSFLRSKSSPDKPLCADRFAILVNQTVRVIGSSLSRIPDNIEIVADDLSLHKAATALEVAHQTAVELSNATAQSFVSVIAHPSQKEQFGTRVKSGSWEQLIARAEVVPPFLICDHQYSELVFRELGWWDKTPIDDTSVLLVYGLPGQIGQNWKEWHPLGRRLSKLAR